MRRAIARVVENRQLSPGIHELRLSAPGWATPALPGQFAMLRAPGDEPLLARPMAFLAADSEGATFGLKVVGRGTRALALAVTGQELTVWGPLGVGFTLGSSQPVLVGGGIGVPPLIMLAETLLARGLRPRAMLLGARSREELFGRERITRLGLAVRIATDDGSEGLKGFVTELLSEETLGPHSLVQACGPTPMLAAVKRAAAAAGARCELSLEARMGCGVGACRGCMVPLSAAARARSGREYLCLCLEGPCLDAEDVELT